MAAVCVFSTRLDYVTLDLTNMFSLQGAKSASLIPQRRLPRKDLSSQSARKRSMHLVGCCLDQLTGKRGWIGLNVTLPTRLSGFSPSGESTTLVIIQEYPRKSKNITNSRATTPGF
jgi:hypothetical protein